MAIAILFSVGTGGRRHISWGPTNGPMMSHSSLKLSLDSLNSFNHRLSVKCLCTVTSQNFLLRFSSHMYGDARGGRGGVKVSAAYACSSICLRRLRMFFNTDMYADIAVIITLPSAHICKENWALFCHPLLLLFVWVAVCQHISIHHDIARCAVFFCIYILSRIKRCATECFSWQTNYIFSQNTQRWKRVKFALSFCALLIK